MEEEIPETFVATAGDEKFLSRARRLWELIKETANPNTMHTEDLTEEQRKRLASFESFDYHKAYPDMYMAYLREHSSIIPFSDAQTGSAGVGRVIVPLPLTPHPHPAFTSTAFGSRTSSSVEKQERKNLIIRWLLHVAIAISVSLMAALVAYAVDGLESFRFHTLSSFVNILHFRIVAQFVGYLFWMSTAIIMMGIGTAVVVFIEPAAGGGGIPTVMAYLNGVNVRRAMNIKTFVVKALSCLFAVASGLPVGIEAPLVHLGAIVGAGVTQGGSQTLGIHTGFFKPFRNHQDRRAFITAGAACGVSAAFGAPIGGLLFVMEEISSSWDHSGSGQIFLASMIAMTTTTMVNSLVEEGKLLGWVSHTASVLFEVNISIPFNLMSIVPALFLGAILGALAALFTKLNIILNKWRNKNVAPYLHRRLLEPVAVIFMYATLTYFLSWASDCRTIKPIGEVNETILQWGTESQARLFSDTCKNQTAHYSPLGTLNMATGKNAIRHLFTRQTAGQLPIPHLLVYFLLYSCFACISSGLSIASGLVVPSLVIGAAFGRLYGLILWYLFSVRIPSVDRGYRAEDSWLDPGLFALIGAAAFLAGTSRLGMSVCVIVVELSSELRYLLPIMVGIVCSKAIANWLSEPLYHHILHLDCVPFLSPQIPSAEFEQLTAGDVMVREVVALRRVEKTETIWKALQTTHHAFPVVEEVEEDGGVRRASRWKRIDSSTKEEGNNQDNNGEETQQEESNELWDGTPQGERRDGGKKDDEEGAGPSPLRGGDHFPHQSYPPRFRGGVSSSNHNNKYSEGCGEGDLAGLLTLGSSHASVLVSSQLSSPPLPFSSFPHHHPHHETTLEGSPPTTTTTTTTISNGQARQRPLRYRFVGLVTREDLQAFLALPRLSSEYLSPSSSSRHTPSSSALTRNGNVGGVTDKRALPSPIHSGDGKIFPLFQQDSIPTMTPTTPAGSSPSRVLLSSHAFPSFPPPRPPSSGPLTSHTFSTENMSYLQWIQHKHNVFMTGGGIKGWRATWANIFSGSSSHYLPMPSSPTSVSHLSTSANDDCSETKLTTPGLRQPIFSTVTPSVSVAGGGGGGGAAAGSAEEKRGVHFTNTNNNNNNQHQYRPNHLGKEESDIMNQNGRPQGNSSHCEDAFSGEPLVVLPATVDLSLIINRSPWVIPPFFNLFMAYKTFSMMGLRHMVVVDGEEVCGVITRKDLLPDALRLRLKELRYRIAEQGFLGVEPTYSGRNHYHHYDRGGGNGTGDPYSVAWPSSLRHRHHDYDQHLPTTTTTTSHEEDRSSAGSREGKGKVSCFPRGTATGTFSSYTEREKGLPPLPSGSGVHHPSRLASSSIIMPISPTCVSSPPVTDAWVSQAHPPSVPLPPALPFLSSSSASTSTLTISRGSLSSPLRATRTEGVCGGDGGAVPRVSLESDSFGNGHAPSPLPDSSRDSGGGEGRGSRPLSPFLDSHHGVLAGGSSSKGGGGARIFIRTAAGGAGGTSSSPGTYFSEQSPLSSEDIDQLFGFPTSSAPDS